MPQKSRPKWFYQVAGELIGPVPSVTLRHLAEYGAITTETRIWKEGMEKPLPARQFSGLFSKLASRGTPPAITTSSPSQLAIEALGIGLEADMLDSKDDLARRSPPIHVLLSRFVARVVLAYCIRAMRELPTPIMDDLPLSERTKPLRHLLMADVAFTTCHRPNYRATRAELLQAQPDLRLEHLEIECKQFAEDGLWLFMEKLD